MKIRAFGLAAVLATLLVSPVLSDEKSRKVVCYEIDVNAGGKDFGIKLFPVDQRIEEQP